MTVSQLLHWIIFRDDSTSLCGRAWRYREESRFWAGWVVVFGVNHCSEAAEWHERRVAQRERR